MQRFLKIFLIVCCFVFSKHNFSQDIRGGWITYKWISGYTYSITATLLIDSATAQSHTIAANFGDATSCTVTINPSVTSGKVKKLTWNCLHTYGGPGYYNVCIIENFRISSIKNITNPGTKSLFITTIVNITQFMGPNNSPIMTSDPIFFTNKGSLLTYNPGVFDSDGDSLSYQLANCAVTPTTDYYLPSNSSINNSTGTFTYQADTIGIFAFKFEIKEWRKNGVGVYQNIGYSDVDYVVDVVASVSINEFDKKESIKIYPNPVSNTLNIKSDSKTNAEIEIINCLGQTVLEQKYSESIDVSKLESGYYILKVTEEKNYYSKFLKE